MLELIIIYLYLLGGLAYVVIGLDCGRLRFNLRAKAIFATICWPIMFPWVLIQGFLK